MNKNILQVIEQRLYRKIIVCVTMYLFPDPVTYYHWQTLSMSFLLEMVIAKDPSYLSLQYFMYSVTVAYHLILCSNNIGTHNETMNSCLLLSFFFICINLKCIPYIKVHSRSLCTCGNRDNFRITKSISKILGSERSPLSWRSFDILILAIGPRNRKLAVLP